MTHIGMCTREGVGVEPTAAGSAPPATDFEDRGIHRDTSLPVNHCSDRPPDWTKAHIVLRDVLVAITIHVQFTET